MQTVQHTDQEYQLAHVHRVTKRISRLSFPDTLEYISTLKSKYTGVYSPVCCMMIVPVGYAVGDTVPGLEHIGPIPGVTY